MDSGEVAAAAKHDMVANIPIQELDEKLRKWSQTSSDQEVILNYLHSTITQTVFTSWTPPRRDHHGYTHG